MADDPQREPGLALERFLPLGARRGLASTKGTAAAATAEAHERAQLRGEPALGDGAAGLVGDDDLVALIAEDGVRLAGHLDVHVAIARFINSLLYRLLHRHDHVHV